MATQGRSGYQQSVGNSAYEDIFVSGTDGPALSGMEFKAENQDILLKIHGLDDEGNGTVSVQRIENGRGWVSRYAFSGSVGLICRVEAQAAASGGTLSWQSEMA